MRFAPESRRHYRGRENLFFEARLTHSHPKEATHGRSSGRGIQAGKTATVPTTTAWHDHACRRRAPRGARNVFDKRFLEWDGSPNQVPTKDKRFIWVDTYARWRITDPLLFFQRLRDELGAQSRLDDILDGETRNAVARHDLIELVRSTNRSAEDIPIESEEEAVILELIERGRQEITREILETASGRTADLGIELLDLRLKWINYVEEVQKDVFARMIAERQRIAEQFRSEGQGESARIHGERERELAQIQSAAYRQAEELRGQTDAEATRIYADAYNRDADFYSFMKSMETYEQTMDRETLFILGTDSELLRFLDRTR